jgi:flagellar basal-body rod protein FlgG
VTHPQHGELFTRCGRFSRSPDGRLVLTTSGGELPVSPEIVLPDDAVAVTISLDGEATVTRSGGASETIGTLSLALFVAPTQLVQQADALFSASERSGAPQLGRPQDGLRGGILQRHLERSNVAAMLEHAWLDQIDTWLELLDSSAVP